MNCNETIPNVGWYKCLVSIPNRDFDELQYLSIFLLIRENRFQSLIGILMNCNSNPSMAIEKLDVSIPNRDFDELQSLGSESPVVFGFQGAVARMNKS